VQAVLELEMQVLAAFSGTLWRDLYLYAEVFKLLKPLFCICRALRRKSA
jgi:hypothetical protein